MGRALLALESDKRKLGQRIKELRNKKKWSQLHLAQAINASQSVVSHWERGDLIPSLAYAKGTAKALGVTIDKLVDGIDL